MTSQWSNFANYRVGDQVQNGSSVVYGCILANTNQPPPNITYWNNLTPSASGLTSLQSLTIADNGGNLTLASGTATFTTVPSTGTINMAIAYPAPPLTAINGLTGSPVITDNTLTSTIQVQTLPPNIEVGLNPSSFGIYVETTGGVTTATISSPLCVTTSVIQVTYIHSGGGGGSQYIKNITAGTGSFVITCNTPIDIADEINWLILNA
jgi:hypothetical protein